MGNHRAQIQRKSSSSSSGGQSSLFKPRPFVPVAKQDNESVSDEEISGSEAQSNLPPLPGINLATLPLYDPSPAAAPSIQRQDYDPGKDAPRTDFGPGEQLTGEELTEQKGITIEFEDFRPKGVAVDFGKGKLAYPQDDKSAPQTPAPLKGCPPHMQNHIWNTCCPEGKHKDPNSPNCVSDSPIDPSFLPSPFSPPPWFKRPLPIAPRPNPFQLSLPPWSPTIAPPPSLFSPLPLLKLPLPIAPEEKGD